MGVYDDDYGTPDEQAANKRKIANLLRAEADEDGNEFEGMTPRELRNIIRTVQDDLRRAVEDRRKLLALVHSVAEDVEDGPLDYVARRIQQVLTEVEGK